MCDIHPSSLSTNIPRLSYTEQSLAQIPQRLHKVLSCFNLSRDSIKNYNTWQLRAVGALGPSGNQQMSTVMQVQHQPGC